MDTSLYRDDEAIRAGRGWERHFAAVADWAAVEGGRRLPRQLRHQGLRIGEWAARQRAAYSAGLIPEGRVRRLEAVPGWYWGEVSNWADTYSILGAFAQFRGSVADVSVGESVFAGLYSAGSLRRRLGVWLAEQRRAYRNGALGRDKARLLEELPGWSWTPVDVEDLAMVDALRAFVESEQHADPPTDHVEDGLASGRWVWAVRRRKATGALAPALEDEIWAATPGHGEGRWRWRQPETRWWLAFDALRCFAVREGHVSPPAAHVEVLPDTWVALGHWVCMQRWLQRCRQLDPAREAVLDDVAGWQWHVDRSRGRWGTLVDAGPTRELVRDLEARGFSRSWMGRELGYQGELQGPHGRGVTGLLAARVADLYRRVGDLRMPPMVGNQHRPSLVELQTAAVSESDDDRVSAGCRSADAGPGDLREAAASSATGSAGGPT